MPQQQQQQLRQATRSNRYCFTDLGALRYGGKELGDVRLAVVARGVRVTPVTVFLQERKELGEPVGGKFAVHRRHERGVYLLVLGRVCWVLDTAAGMQRATSSTQSEGGAADRLACWDPRMHSFASTVSTAGYTQSECT